MNEQSIYIGTYLKITLNPIKAPNRIINKCPVHGSDDIDKDDNFCRVCGRQIISVECRDDIKYPSICDILGDDDNLIPIYINKMNDNERILISNIINDKTHVNIDSNGDGELEFPCNTNDMFMNQFKKYIDMMKQNNHVRSINLVNGIITYWS